MRVLFVHQNFPAQFKHVATALARDPANQVVAMAVNKHAAPARVQMQYYEMKTKPSQAHPLAVEFERKMIWAERAALTAERMKKGGFTPDIIIGHPGWGETLFLRDVWPEARILSYMEFYFRRDSDFEFDRSPISNPAEYWNLRARNATLLMSIEASDWCISPMQWQWRQLPDFARAKTSVIHEGIDTKIVRPDPEASITLGRVTKPCVPGHEVVTFVNRNLEPYRGFHVFMKALPEILQRRPNARAVIVGASGLSYGKAAPGGQSWRAAIVAELADKLDFSRIHFVGNVPYATYLKLLQISAAHVYLTYPFVLSWSLLEAMAAECLCIGSRTQPVTEVIEHERNGLLVDFFSSEEVANSVVAALENPRDYGEMRKAARQTIVERFELGDCLARQLDLISNVARGNSMQSFSQASEMATP
jgi:glycosyltransferase involved in cell wall biosynthesis